MEEQKCHSVGEDYAEGTFLLWGRLGGRSEGKKNKFSWRLMGGVENESGHLP